VSARALRKELVDLVDGVPGWRLEPRTTPGASPVWCFVTGGKIEFSVSVEGSELVLYDMETDRDTRFADRQALEAWLKEHRPDTLQEAPPQQDRKAKARKFFEWE
jgi:hypothetical protein